MYGLGCRIVKKAFDTYMGQGLLDDMHTAGCFIELLYYLEKSDDSIVDLSVLKAKLIEQVKSSITKNTEEWESSYICKPSQFFSSKDSAFYEDNKEIAQYECDFIVKTQLDDGSWNIPWSWTDYPEQWAVTKNWWKSNGAILNMLYLKGVGIQ